MNPHSRSLFNQLRRAWFGFVFLLVTTLLICLPAKAAQIEAQKTGWDVTGSLGTGRFGHSATLLANGKVLVAGGRICNGAGCTEFSSAELYNPATESWTPAADLNVARGNHCATLLADGKVLISGGNGGGSPGLASAELFDSLTPPPQITGATVSGKNLFVQGRNFDDGAKIYLNDERQKTANDESNPTGMLIGKKADKKIGRGETVRLKVHNADGTESAEFNFTRPIE